jgi:hypothetical protein
MQEMKILIEGDHSRKINDFGVLTLIEQAARNKGNGYWQGAESADFGSKECQRWFWDIRSGFDIWLLAGWCEPGANITEMIKLSGVRHFAPGQKGEGIYKLLAKNAVDVPIKWEIAEVR